MKNIHSYGTSLVNSPPLVPKDAFGSAIDGWMQTYTGRKVHPFRPDPESIDIRDIAASLSKMCRYSGHCLQFYSVAEHSVLIAERAPDWCKLTALMHDASEAYLVDVPRPLKPHLAGYYQAEARIQETIASRFNLTWPMPEEVRNLDNAILSDERAQNMAPMNEPPEQWGNLLPALGVELRFWSPVKAEYEFLAAFRRYGGHFC